ncbi:histidinol-phosphate aminotransferase [Kurthia zopfii]|uniref:Histidinol-phosphate aminotransferase n=1 Tax=Kurthia zopfii TaxID=1650 RepID=A0A8B4Q9C8_9BACL|nr:histidinol-phosphate transaminase [Kurthia zopfii]PWI23400.1 histidinol-phosphate transaminase [Kurthia zopfii]TDR39865.1 histidinol phosphate aminotransferase [Kurthia zopfii]GEK30753.1 histidinol-phosphate aminotransferase [Kurthia zopfii]STX09314.1 Histidinol-phosphate aminotransferase [Kurthia zopfii]
MKWKESVKGLKAYQPGKSIDAVKREFGLDEIVKLASNENPLGCSPKVTAYLQESAHNFALYPDGYGTDMRNAVANHLNVNPNQLIFGNGSDELISIVTRALLQPGVNTVMATPTFSQYKLNAVIEGAEVREVPLKNRLHDLDAMYDAIDAHTAVVWICSPNNPTGGIVEDAPLQAFLAKVPSDVLVVLDEAYFEYVTSANLHDSISLLNQYKNILILRTFSKAYGLAAFRVGYGIAHPDLIAKFDPVRGPFNNTVLSQAIVPVAVADQAYLEQCREVNEAGKKQYITFCEANQLDYCPTETNFILFEVKMDSDEVFQKLMEKGYIIRSGNALGVPQYIRVTIGTKEQNEGLLAQLQTILQQQGVVV